MRLIYVIFTLFLFTVVHGDVITITEAEQLNSLVTSRTAIVGEFYTDFCADCEKKHPVFEEAMKKMDTMKNHRIGVRINCAPLVSICRSFNVTKYPTYLIIFQNSTVLDCSDFETASDLTRFVHAQTNHLTTYTTLLGHQIANKVSPVHVIVFFIIIVTCIFYAITNCKRIKYTAVSTIDDSEPLNLEIEQSPLLNVTRQKVKSLRRI
ncbi:hypothetical protein WA158_005253 [Blastocystis sp. Blastoise]